MDDIQIFRVDTGEAVKSIADLKANIKLLKEELSGLEIGSKEYADTLVALQTNQSALKNAMHDTTYETDDQADKFAATAKAAQGLGTSYNALVKRMADLDQQFRATEDATQRANLGAQIKAINAQLKQFDEDRGKYGRNVGNYKSALDGLSASFKATAGSAGAAINPIAGMTAGLKALSATPAVAILGLLANALTKVIDGLKSSEENTDKWNMALAAFKPVADAATRTIQAVGGAIADAANWIVDLLDKWGLMRKEMGDYQALESASQAVRDLARRNIEENARLQRDADEHREKAADKEKYTAEQRLAFLKEAQREEKAIMLNNLAEARQRVALLEEEAKRTQNSTTTFNELAQARANLYRVESDYNKIMRRLTKETNSALNETRANQRAAVQEQADGEQKAAAAAIASTEEIARALEEADRKADEERARRLEEQNALEEESEAMTAALTESIQTELDAQLEAEWDALEEEKRIKQARIQVFQEYASGIANLAGALADIYEADSEADEEAAQKAKALRTASAIINTISGAVSAYMNTIQSIPVPAVAIPLAVINAASVLAAGYAQVKQINAVKVGSGGGGSAGGGSAVVSAPSFSASVPAVRNVTGKSEEERLNRMADPVKLVWSDVEAKNRQARVEIEETTW